MRLRRNVSYRDLADRLEKLKVSESERNIANKTARREVLAVFFVACLNAIGCHTLHLDGA